MKHTCSLSICLTLLLIALAAGCTAPLAPIRAPEGSEQPAAVAATEVIVFAPAAATGEPQTGSCWTSSLAVWRSDAWRCMVENTIYDPCFATGEGVICGASPTSDTLGFALTLTEPLPAPDLTPEMQDAEDHAWLVELADGTICGFATGATTGVDGERANYLCQGDNPSKNVVLLGELTAGTVWQVKKVLLGMGPEGSTAEETAIVDVRSVWR